MYVCHGKSHLSLSLSPLIMSSGWDIWDLLLPKSQSSSQDEPPNSHPTNFEISTNPSPGSIHLPGTSNLMQMLLVNLSDLPQTLLHEVRVGVMCARVNRLLFLGMLIPPLRTGILILVIWTPSIGLTSLFPSFMNMHNWVVVSNICVIFTPTWGSDPVWLIFFRLKPLTR